MIAAPSAALLAGVPGAAQNAPAAPPAFAACKACHTVIKGQKSGLGPNLNGVADRSAAVLPEFRYSAAVEDSNIRWDDKALDEFLAAPARKVPGTRMPIGMVDPAKRATIIAYLAAQKYATQTKVPGLWTAAGRSSLDPDQLPNTRMRAPETCACVWLSPVIQEHRPCQRGYKFSATLQARRWQALTSRPAELNATELFTSFSSELIVIPVEAREDWMLKPCRSMKDVNAARVGRPKWRFTWQTQFSSLAALTALTCLQPTGLHAQQVSGAVAPKLRAITVDASSDLGPLKPLRGVNSGPLPWSDRPAAERLDDVVEVSDRTGYRSLGVDASNGYRNANIDLIRIHDNYGPGDIYANFRGTRTMADGTKISASSLNGLAMFPDINADPLKPSSYNFAPTDKLMNSIQAVGARAIFRLGASAGENSGVPDTFTNERDYDHYASIAHHVVLHYNKGWHNGFQYGIKYWEVLNEPDGRFEAQKYYRLYGKLAKAVKSADRSAWIGGPALMFTHNGPSYRENFLRYLRKNKLPLDFWTFHDYNVDAADPYLYVRIGEDMRALLDEHGFKKAKIIMDEWNVLGINPQLLTLGGRAAFTTSAIIYMQDSPIDEQTFYMGPNLFGMDGRTPDKIGQAFTALGAMKNTPVRLSVKGDDKQGFAVQAGKSADGSKINIIISNYEVPESLRGPRPEGDFIEGAGFKINLLPRRNFSYEQNDGFDVRVNGLDPNKLYRVERYRISDVWDYRLLSTAILKGSEIRIQQTLAPPSIERISISLAAQ